MTLNNITRVSIKTAKNSTELVKSANDWVVSNRDNFPAQFTAVKNALLSVANTQIIEEKLRNPRDMRKLA